MTTVTDRPLPAPAPATGRSHLGHALRAEWTKITSVRSTVWTIVITVVLGIGLGALVTSAQASNWASRSPAEQLAFDPTRASLVGLLFAQLAIGVLGALVVTAEYSTRTIDTSLAAVPRRSLVLTAKALVFGALVLVVGEVVDVIAFLVGQAILHGHTPTTTLANPSALRAVLGGGLYLVVLGLIALGLGAVLRHTAAAISAFVGGLFVIPIIAALLPSNYDTDISRFLPTQIGAVMLTAGRAHMAGAFTPWVGFTWLCVYAAVALAAGYVTLLRRDV